MCYLSQYISSCGFQPHFVTLFKISVFVADHDICAAKDGLSPYFLYRRHLVLARLTRSSAVGCSNTLLLGCFNARLAEHFSSIHFDSLTHFIPLCIIHFELLVHSLTRPIINSFIHSFIFVCHVCFGLIGLMDGLID